VGSGVHLIALLQRVLSASIAIDGVRTAQIDAGLLVFIGVRPADDEDAALRLLTRVVNYRIFADDTGKMNVSLLKIGGELLLVPQFTLAADARHGLRPSFSAAAPPAQALRLFDSVVRAAHMHHPRVQSGAFGANMQVSLVNDGPVTLWLES